MEFFVILFLIFLSAIFSGLTLGFFSLDKGDLRRKAELGDLQSRKILPIREKGNLLLSTLLIGNVAVNSTLSIFLGSLVSGVVAGIMATLLIVIFGEIIPQSIFSRYALSLGAKLSYFVKILIIIFYPICRPISYVLDKILGDEMPSFYSRHELMRIVEEHEDSQSSDIDEDEERIIKGALSFSNKTVYDIMTPRTEMFSLDAREKLNSKAIKIIFESGRSRIPIFEDNKDDIVGILYVKDLIANNYKNKTVKQLARKKVLFVDYNKPLDELLKAFKTTRSHLFIVMGEYGNVTGIVTIEDVLEEIIGEEIMDEYDKFVDLQELAKQKARNKKIIRV